ncbi:hypothetical protein [Pseudoalteromonas nigrifaciens]|uniref:hypothetical protein n=1 Tax=Pseudoalteromonas nigrifaciens TaxID=28109 RepID=UPI003FCF97EC
MDFYSIIANVVGQVTGIMDGLKPMMAFGGLVIFTLSGKTLLTATHNEKQARAVAWSGLFFSTFLISIERWMNIASSTLYGGDLGPIYRVGQGFNNSQDALMIFNAVEVFVKAFGWFGFFAAVIKLSEAPKYNSPGMRRRAFIAMGIAVAMVNIEVTINIIGYVFTQEADSYSSMKDILTR